MPLDEQDFRAITFQGVTFPPTLMGISILIRLADEDFGKDSELGDWLLRLTVCSGVTKDAPADRCARCAQQAIDLMLEYRPRVLEDLQECLVLHGFEVETTYRDWLFALQRIVELSKATDGKCFWSAPSHPKDPIQNAEDAKSFLRNLKRAGERLLEDERKKQNPYNRPTSGEAS